MRNKLLSVIMMILLVIAVVSAGAILDMYRNENVEKPEPILNALNVLERNGDATKVREEGIFSSHLPVVMIETDGQTITKEETIWSTISIIDNENGKNYLGDEYQFQTAATLRYRGSSSIMFDKKQYRLAFFEEREGTKRNNISVMGMPKEGDWVLNGPFLDRSLIRNSLLYDVSRDIMDWAPNTRYCEVFLEGVYQGVYLMVESVKVSDSRVDLKDFSLINGETAYMLQREMTGTGDNVINNFGTYAGKTYHELSIQYPSKQKLIERQKEWIRKDVSEFERILYSNQFDDKETGYSKYIDVDSFVDYYIINEFAMINDAGYLSTIVYKDLGGKMKITVWDFNNAFDNYPSMPIASTEFSVHNNNWFERLIQDRSFTEKVVKRYHELRKGVLGDNYLIKIIDDTALYLGDSVDRNFAVWGYTFEERLLLKDKERISRDPTNYKEALKMLKDEIIDRGKFLDENIETLYQYSINTKSKKKIF